MADNGDRVQRQMDFIGAQQTQFTVDIQELKDLHKEAERRMTKIEGVCLRLGNALVNLAETTNENAMQLSSAQRF
ncbi:MAG: hypothetical protein ACT4OT_18065 [Acidobacteriota bacterium]